MQIHLHMSNITTVATNQWIKLIMDDVYMLTCITAIIKVKVKGATYSYRGVGGVLISLP